MVITYYIKLIAKVANRHNNILVSLLILVTEMTRTAVKYLFCKKFTLDINLPNYLFIGIVDHWSVPSIFKTLGKM